MYLLLLMSLLLLLYLRSYSVTQWVQDGKRDKFKCLISAKEIRVLRDFYLSLLRSLFRKRFGLNSNFEVLVLFLYVPVI